MRNSVRSSLMTVSAALVAGAGAAAGCASKTPPPEPPPHHAPDRPPPVPVRSYEPEKPLPNQGGGGAADGLPPPPFNDVPLVNQRPPEQRAFVEAYEAVGRPRILVFVNRTLEGEIVPPAAQGPVAHPPRREADYAGRDPVRDSAYLHHGEYDEVDARALDYEAMENILTDWLASDGQVEVVSPIMARQRLTEEQVRDLQSGRPRMLSEIAHQLDADILVQAQAHPTRQTANGLEVRVTAEAINVSRGGQSIARAVVEVPPPLDKRQLNTYTRFLARKLMDGMIGSWHSLGDRDHGGGAGPGADQRIEGRDRNDRPVPDDRSDTRREPPPAREPDRLAPRDASPRDAIDDRAPPTRPAPTTRPSAPADTAPAGNK